MPFATTNANVAGGIRSSPDDREKRQGHRCTRVFVARKGPAMSDTGDAAEETHGATHGPAAHGTPSACARRCRFVEDISGQDKPELAAVAPLVRLARRTTIYSRGDEAHHCYKVVEGAVRLTRILMDGHRQVLEILLPNDSFGIETTGHYATNAEAIGEVVLLRCPRACITRLNEESPRMRRSLMAMLSRGLTAAQDHVMMLGHQGAKARLASFLLRLMETGAEGEGKPLELPVGRQDLADYLGLTIETTCRTLTDFKQAGMITIPNRHQIIIRKSAALRALAEGDDA
jgi:CRP-like cAMP-binding protein